MYPNASQHQDRMPLEFLNYLLIFFRDTLEQPTDRHTYRRNQIILLDHLV